MNTHNWPFLLVALIFTTSQACLLATLYSGYIKDKEVLYAESQIEYDSSFVKRKIFTLKADATTQTNQEVSWDYLYPKVDKFNVTGLVTGIPTGPVATTPSENGHFTGSLLNSRIVEHPSKTKGQNLEDFTDNPWADVNPGHANKVGSETPRTPGRSSNGTITGARRGFGTQSINTRNLGRSSRSNGNNNNNALSSINGNSNHSPNVTKIVASPSISAPSSTFTTPTKPEMMTRRRR